MDETTKAYMAGIFEDAGFVIIKHTKPNLVLTIPINNLHADILAIFEEVYEVKYSDYKSPYSRHKNRSHVCSIFTDMNAVTFLVDIYPYLRTERTKRIGTIVSTYYELMRKNTQIIEVNNILGGKQHKIFHGLHSEEIKKLITELRELI